MRGTPIVEQIIHTLEFDHQCFGDELHLKKEAFPFHFICQKLPDGRMGVQCPNCHILFIYQAK
jgi:hypothetical protein